MKKGQISGLVWSFILFFIFGVCQAQEKYPNRIIELVAPTRPGGSSDIHARVYSEELAQILKVPVTVVNRDGGSGAIGTNYVAKAKKDGYTLLAGPSSSLVVMPIISKDVTYDPINDFTPLGYLGFVPSTIAVRADSPFKTLQELIEYAKKNPDKLKNGHAGIGTESYINLEFLCYHNKIKINSIPFSGGSEALTALLGGHVDMASSSLTTMGLQHKAGKVRILAVTAKTRIPEFPDVPTTTELGHSYANIRVWHAAFAPAGVPKSVLDVLIPAVEKAFKNPEVVERAKKVGLVVEYMGPEELRKTIESEIIAFKKIAEKRYRYK